MATNTKKKVETKSEFTNEQIKHLEFIQGGINRFASNSFQMKGWMLTIVSALLGFLVNSGESKFALVAILPVVVFWGLDSYYLQLERKFRGIYNDVINPDKAQKPVGLFEMPFQNYTSWKYSFWNVFLSQTVLLLYFPVIVLLVAAYLYL